MKKLRTLFLFCYFISATTLAQEKMETAKNTLQGLRTAIYRVSDINQGREWYKKVLETDPYFNESFYVGFNVNGYELGLLPEEGANKGKSEGINCYWGVADVTTFYNKLIDLGAKEYEKPNDVGGGIIVALVKDPWDNLFGIIYNPHFKFQD